MKKRTVNNWLSYSVTITTFIVVVLLTIGCESKGTGSTDNISTQSSSSLHINEFMASNSSTITDPQGDYDDWIEIYNSGDNLVSLMGMYLTDDLAQPDKWQFPDITLNAGEFLIVWADDDIEDGGLHAGFKLSGSGEEIGLFDNDLSEIDSLIFEAQAQDISFGSYPDGSDNRGFLNPTPGEANTEILSELPENPNASRPVGWSDESHGDNVDPNYDVVFPEGEVKQIELIIDPAAWQAMLDDMTDMYGEFGTGDNGGVRPDDNQMFPEGTDACIGKNEGDTCETTIMGQTMIGSCIMDGGNLVCSLNNRGEEFPGVEFPGGEPPEGEFPGGEMPGGQFPGDGLPGDPFPGGEPPEGGVPGGEIPGGGNVSLTDRNPVWKPCTFRFEDTVWHHVGIRFKGNSSLRSTWRSGIWKMPLRFDFDQFEDDYPEIDDQRFYGFKKLTLSSNYNDDSLLREKIAADIFREAGVPAAKTAFYRVYVDHGQGSEYFGLYTMVEVPDNPMLNKYFQNADGNLYKPEGTGATFASFDENSFDKENNQDEADWSDVKALFDTLHSSRQDPIEWRAGIDKVLNVDGFLRWLAVNTLIQNWDTYGVMSHNYYLYTNPEDGLIHWIPWDNNESLMEGMGGGMGDSGMRRTLSLSLAEVNENWPLIRYLVDDDPYWEKYVSFVEETAEGAFEPEKMKAKYKEAHDLIGPYVVGEQGEMQGYTFLSSPDNFDAALEYLYTHVENRYNEALQFLAENP